jgi:uncharacterized membrane protein YdjX (TVP38/TMEM64 family)
MRPGVRRIVLFSYIVVVLIGFLLCRIFSTEIQAGLLGLQGPDGWANWMQHAIGAASLFAAFVVSIFFSIPVGPLGYIAFGYFYGPYEGTVMADFAATTGSVAAFFFFRNALPRSNALQRVAVENVFMTLLMLRSSPWIPNPLITVFCSAFDIDIVTFTLTTFIGTLPLIAVYTFAANRLHGHLDVSALYSTDFAIAVGLLSAISLLGFLKPVRTILDHLKAVQAGDAGDDRAPPGRLRKRVKIACL